MVLSAPVYTTCPTHLILLNLIILIILGQEYKSFSPLCTLFNDAVSDTEYVTPNGGIAIKVQVK
jgi:hypothetical protein